jgi:nucleoid-associated protein YgaU
MTKLILFMALILNMSCSGSKKAADSISTAGLEIADSDEYSSSFSEDVIAGNLGDYPAESKPKKSKKQKAPIVMSTGEHALYTASNNETLMLIAFKIYGDYGQWKNIQALNQDILGVNGTVKAGMQLKYEKPAAAFIWQPEGNSYLIKSGDTLGKISNESYGSQKYWKNIWNNNKPLIKDPNKIFAGFTIYTPVIESRDVANKDILDL